MMRFQILVLVVAGLGLFSSSSSAIAQEIDAAAMERMAAFATPGPMHEQLKWKEGNWNLSIKMWMAPGTPAIESEGTSEMKMILGGRYLQDQTKSEFQGTPFEGHGLTAFDNMQEKFLTQWIDNMGTSFMTGEGTFDEATKQWSYTAKTPDPMSGEIKEFRSTEKIVDSDTWVMTMFTAGPDGNEFKSMEITYKRAK